MADWQQGKRFLAGTMKLCGEIFYEEMCRYNRCHTPLYNCNSCITFMKDMAMASAQSLLDILLIPSKYGCNPRAQRFAAS